MKWFFLIPTVAIVLVWPSLMQADEPDSLLSLLPSTQGAERIEVLNELSYFYVDREPSKAKSYSLEAKALLGEVGNDSLKGAVFRALGNACRTIGSLDSAEFYLLRAIRHFGNSNVVRARAVCSYSLSAVYLDQRRLDQALEALQPAMDYFREHEPLTYVSIVPAMAMILTDMKQSGAAVRLLRETIDMNQASDNYDVIGEAFLRGNLGKALADHGTPDVKAASREFRLAADIFRDHEMLFPLRTTLGDLANAYLNLGMLDSALITSREALRVAEALDHPEGKMLANLSVGECYISLGKPQLARNHLETALELESAVEDITARYEAYGLMARLEEAVGHPQAALSWMQRYSQLQDSIYRRESLQQLNEMQVRYETEQKERELAEQELVLQKQRSQIVLLSAGAVILGLLMLGGYLFFQSRMRSRLQQAVIKEQEKGFEAIFSAIEAERQRIAGDLHDGVGQQLTALNLGLQQMDMSDAGAKRIKALLDEVSRDVRELSHEMMPPSLKQVGLLPAMESSLTQSLKGTKFSYEFDHFQIRERYPEQVEITLFRVFQELINNALKHSGGDKIGVQLFETAGRLRLVVDDNGNGGLRLSQPGVGLRNMKNRLHLVNGRMESESDPDHGTTVAVSIPI